MLGCQPQTPVYHRDTERRQTTDAYKRQLRILFRGRRDKML